MPGEYFADLHIHIGSADDGTPVKITASRKLNFFNIAAESLARKGLDMVGIIDCCSPPVIRDIESLLAAGEMRELENGGIIYRDKLLIIPGAEVESREEKGPAHYLSYFPHLENIKEFSAIMDQYITNINLSSQQTGLTGSELYKITAATGGVFIPAHAFTPHKSFYGKVCNTCGEIFTARQWDKIPAIELGLSADTELADYLKELSAKTFLSNSDAHSVEKIAREYNVLRLEHLDFSELMLALQGKEGRGVVKNFGLDPRLGKYHRSYCQQCEKNFTPPEPVTECPLCGSEGLITGVKDRILTISEDGESISPAHRPPYIHQVPLLNIPGIGSKTLAKLLAEFNTEMNILHRVPEGELRNVVSEDLARKIKMSSRGEAEIIAGGGGQYGRVVG